MYLNDICDELVNLVTVHTRFVARRLLSTRNGGLSYSIYFAEYDTLFVQCDNCLNMHNCFVIIAGSSRESIRFYLCVWCRPHMIPIMSALNDQIKKLKSRILAPIPFAYHVDTSSRLCVVCERHSSLYATSNRSTPFYDHVICVKCAAFYKSTYYLYAYTVIHILMIKDIAKVCQHLLMRAIL